MGCFAKAQHPNALIAYTMDGVAQGTTYSIKYYANQPIDQSAIDSLLQVIDNSMSIYNEDSKISLFNNPKVRKIKMDEHMKAVIRESFKTYDMTDGYFDITVMPLINLWGFGPQGFKNNPTDKEVQKAKSMVGMQKLSIKGNYLIKKNKNLAIDVNGIAQGYTVDVLGNYFLAHDISNFIIEVGGEIVTRGVKPNGEFIVEIQRPYQSNEKEETHKIKLKDKAITTSGSYEKRRLVDGKYISHHIDPKTGYPIESQTLSVTLIANSALEADAIDNYLMFLPADEIIQYIENQKDMEVYVIYVENNTVKELQSFGFNNYIYK